MKEFDRIIRNKMSKAEAAYPDDMWQRIQKNLPEKKKKVYPVWLMVSVILVSSGALALWFNSGRIFKTAVADTAIAAASFKVNNPTNNQVSANIDEQSSLDNKGLSSLPLAAKEQSISTLTSKAIYQTNSNAVEAIAFNNEISNSSNISNPLEESSVHNAQGSSLDDAATFGVIEDEITNSAQKLIRRGERHNAPTIASFLRVFGTDQSDVIEGINTSMKKHSVLQCPTFVRKENLSFFEVYFSNDYAIRSLTAKSPEFNGYKALREQTEHSYLSYSAGFRVGMGWNNGIAMKTGVNYSSINEKFTYTDPNSVQIKTITIIKYIYDDQFNVIDSIKTTENVSIPGTNTVTQYNKISLVDIPVLMQYTIPGKRRLSYNLVCGPLINLSLVQSGKILNSNSNELVNLQDQNIYKNNIGLSFYGGIGINYQLTKNIQISIEPNARIMTSSVSRVTHPIDQKYWVASVAAAFRYKI
jgi:hypothetical protein